MRNILLSAIAMLACVSASATTVYISDELAVPLRRGPSNQHKILHAGLPSGTALEVIGEAAAGFSRVRAPNGLEGWVPTQHLLSEPIAKDRLAAANRRIESLEAQLKSLRENYKEARGAHTQVESRAAELGKESEKLQAELAELRRISASSISHYEENKRLKAENQSLTTQLMQVTERTRQLERNLTLKWLLAGGALVLLGLILGAWIKSRPKRSSWA
ncbi:MAG TPA: TIGR04211 family SH3 domain-containing protein [Steroidobacter sp.]|nr:TIGR04211 family SH3 domain-containing protein [Steroidobacter sp.]